MRSRVVRLLAVSSLCAVAACGSDSVGADTLDKVAEGISRDSLLSIIGRGPLVASGADTARLVNGFRQMRYYASGANFEVLYMRDSVGNVTEPVQQKLETPVVLRDGKVIGTGWRFYVDAMKQYSLPSPLPPAEPPVDSTKKS